MNTNDDKYTVGVNLSSCLFLDFNSMYEISQYQSQLVERFVQFFQVITLRLGLTKSKRQSKQILQALTEKTQYKIVM